MKLSLQQCYDALNYNWYNDTDPAHNGAIWPSAPIYFTTASGDYGFYQSTGPEMSTANREYYIKSVLMWDAAHYLYNSGCTGNVTNIRPKSYQPMPIYFK